jgi:hypothetical protein
MHSNIMRTQLEEAKQSKSSTKKRKGSLHLDPYNSYLSALPKEKKKKRKKEVFLWTEIGIRLMGSPFNHSSLLFTLELK